MKPPWRNWLARSAVNRKVGGSSPPGGEYFNFFEIDSWMWRTRANPNFLRIRINIQTRPNGGIVLTVKKIMGN